MHGDPVYVLLYGLVVVLFIVAAATIRLWTGRKLTRQQWDKIGSRVEAIVVLGILALGSAATLYYHFVQ